MSHVLSRADMSVVLAVCTPSQPAMAPDPSTAQAVPLTSPFSPNPAEHAHTNPAGNVPQKSVALDIQGRMDSTVRDIRARGGYGGVEVGFCRNQLPSVEEAIRYTVAQGARQILVVPAVISILQIPSCQCFVEESANSLRERVAKIQAQYPDAKIVYAAPPFDHERLVDLALSKIREYEPPTFKPGVTRLNNLRAGETAVVREVDGGVHFRSRMASLGFTPGALLKMVQNYGHGAVIISLRGTRVALGRGEARKVGVSPRRDY